MTLDNNHTGHTGGNPVNTEEVRPQAVGRYKGRLKSLSKFAVIFFGFMVIGTIGVILVLVS